MGTRLVGRIELLDQARLLALEGRGVLFAGEPGVGKTRLLTETLNRLSADDGWHAERFVATAAMRKVPFGPLISLLPAGAADRTQQVAGIRRRLVERAGGRSAALAIDDAHLLDSASLACLADLVHHTEVVLIGATRTTEPVPPDLTALWASEAVARIDLVPLDRALTEELATELLDGPVSRRLTTQLWERTRGVPLFVRELLLDATTQRLLAVEDNGVWTVRRTLRTGSRMQELVQARVASLNAPARELLELLAVAESIATDLLAADEVHELDELEQRGLTRNEFVAGRSVVHVDHPLISEAVAAMIPTRRRLELLGSMAERLIAAGCATPGDALRAAGWQEECGEPVPAVVAIAAGREALDSLALDRAAELADTAIEELPRDAYLLLGEALRLQARSTEAEVALARAAELADDDETITRVAMWRSTLRAHHADDPEGAMTLLNAAADRVRMPERALELRSEAAFLAGVLGRFDVAADTNRRILATAHLDVPARWTTTMNLLFSQVMLADLTDIDDPLDSMAAMIDEVAPSRPEGVDLYWAMKVCAYLLRGELERCEAEFVPHVQRCIAVGQLHGATAAILVYALLYRGSPHALTMATAGCADTAQSDPYLVEPIARAGLTIAHANTGDLERARTALADVDLSHTGDLRLDGFIGRAQAAILSLDGRYDEAAEAAATAGRRCIAGTYLHLGALSLYDAVRYGRADLVIDEVTQLRARTNAPLVEVIAAHALAQHAGDVDALLDVAHKLAAMQARNLVVEALDDIARIAPDTVVAGRAATTAALWRRSTPMHNARARPVPPPLTDREIDVVERALLGQPSKTIAEDLFVSVRTVDNHLAQAYRKLTVNSRADLADALTPLAPSTAS